MRQWLWPVICVAAAVSGGFACFCFIVGWTEGWRFLMTGKTFMDDDK